MSSALRHLLRVPEAAICALITALYLLIWPVGEYAIIDDWAYVKSLGHLQFEGDLTILDWNPMSLVGQLFWGLAFTKLFGFSFTVTKLSVAVLHMVECLVLFRTLAVCRVGDKLALGAVFALALNPLHLAHAFTFMTDVPALTFQVLSLFCYLKALLRSLPESDVGAATMCPTGDGLTRSRPFADRAPRRDLIWFVAGSLSAAEAFLIRQNGVLVPAALFVYLAVFEPRRFTLRHAAAAFIPFALVVAVFTFWYQRIHGVTSAYEGSFQQVLAFVKNPPLTDLPYIAFAFFIYGGWFVLPLAAATPLRLPRGESGVGKVAFGLIALAAVDSLVYFGLGSQRAFPYIWNVVTPFGLFRPDELFLGAREPLWGTWMGWVFASASLLSALVFAFWLTCGERSFGEPAESAYRERTRRAGASEAYRARLAAKRLATILLAMQVAYVFATAPILFDRHLLIFAPTAVIVFCIACSGGTFARAGWPSPARGPDSGNGALTLGTGLDRPSPGGFAGLRFFACLLPMAFYAVTTTHDLHALSRATFCAGQQLVDQGVDPRSINAGYAFDGWHTYELASQHNHSGSPPEYWWQPGVWDHINRDRREVELRVRREFAWWDGRISVSTDRKWVVFCAPGEERPGTAPYVIERRCVYRNWWPWRVNSVFVARDPSLR